MNYVSNYAHKSQVPYCKKVFVNVHPASFEMLEIEQIVANM